MNKETVLKLDKNLQLWGSQSQFMKKKKIIKTILNGINYYTRALTGSECA